MEILEHILSTNIGELECIKNIQFGFMTGRGTTDLISLLKKLQAVQIKKNIYFAFVDLENAFDRVPRRILWREMWKLRNNEWIIQIAKSMYAHSKVRIINSYSSSINASVGVHQGSVLSPLLFNIIAETLSREFRTGCPWELLYANVIVAESYGELKVRLKNGKDGLEEKRVKVNVGKAKVLCSRHDVFKSKIPSVKFSCGVCMKGVGANSILYLSCRNSVYKRCSRIKATLRN